MMAQMLFGMLRPCVWAVIALVSGLQLASSTNYQTSRQISYRYVYPSSRAITGPNVCKSNCCHGWQLNYRTGRCTIAICRPHCRNSGRCRRPNQCACPPGFFGSYCQYEAYYRPSTGIRPGGGSSSGRPISGPSISFRPSSGGSNPLSSVGSQRITSITRPLTSGTATVIRPGSSRTYISSVRPGTSSGSRTYSLTYTAGRGNTVSTNGQGTYSSTTSISPQSSGASGLPNSHALARFTMRGPCFRRVDSNHCRAPLSDVTTLHDDCCSTVGRGWGDECYACPQVLGRELQCPRGFKKSPLTRKCIDVDECDAFDNICMHGTCLNSLGSYRCRCDEGYMSDSSGTQCVVSVKQVCYTRVISGQCYSGSGSRIPTTRMQCCCSLGVAWGVRCEPCPVRGSAAFRAMCPQGTGYHYKPSNGYNHVSALANPPSHLDPCITNPRICLNGQCTSTGNGAYRCDCSRGFHLSSRGNQCIDINECRETRDICRGGRCLNSYGSYHCICAQGLTRRGGTCEDINECTSRTTSPCGEYVCLNTRGSFHCSRTKCATGYRFDITYQRCVDINECTTENVCEHGRCINIGGSFRCMCHRGFTSNPLQSDCIDVDECGQTRDRPLCGSEAVCVNEVGTYRCHCLGDTIYDSDSQACLAASQGEPEVVAVVERKECYGSISDLNFCSNLLGSNVTQQECCCTVGAGWGDNCDLIVCPRHGSAAYNETCPVGPGRHVITQRRPADLPTLPTFSDMAAHEAAGEKAIITGIDECDLFSSVCGTATCIDQEVLFHCDCPEGYKFDDDDKTCIVGDHCLVYPGVCGNGTCENVEEGYNCKCSTSYEFDSSLRACLEIDHCVSPGICGNGSCSSTESGPACSCPDGQQFDQYLRTCQVQDYCIVYEGACGNGTCLPREDGYNCECPAGYQFDERIGSCAVSNFCIVLSGVCGNGTCIAAEGGYSCRCPSGFEFDSEGAICKDIDLCNTYPHLCGNGTCVDVGQNVNCICPTGFEFSTTRLCLDINECSLPASPCGSEATCENTPGSYHCSCPSGFAFDPDQISCRDVNECQIVPDVCGNATCTNLEGGYQCSCAFGYEYSQTLQICTDTNECADYRGICSNGTCVNTQGSYRCMCPRGFEYVAGHGNGCLDINECHATPGICNEATCFNTEGSFSCRCNPGYSFDALRKTCVDINECVQLLVNCGNGECENSDGSFRCVCEQGFQFDETRRLCIHQAQPPSTFGTNVQGHTTSRNPDTREDPDCPFDPDTCGNGTCAVDQHGWATCTCDSGFQYHSIIRTCVDIDECVIEPNICGSATCQNKIGRYSCLCPEGYTFKKKKKKCTDLNECKRYPTLCNNGRCVNKKGSFACMCPPGEQFSYHSRRCVAISSPDPCKRNPGVCGNGTCTSHGHSIRCLCPNGFDYDPSVKQCQAVNECDVPNRCTGGAVCQDTASGYRCMCSPGYSYNYDHGGCTETSRPPPQTSSGIPRLRPVEQPAGPVQTGPNECNEVPSPCINGVCVNTADGFLCHCQTGYNLVDSVRCEDINECSGSDAHHMCMFGNCINEVGSYRCECPAPLILDSTRRRCIELIGPVLTDMGDTPQDEMMDTCWSHSRSNEDICTNAVSGATTYQDCCCNKGVSWGRDCFACPLRNSEDYMMLCVPFSTFSGQSSGANVQVADQQVPGIPGS